MRIELDDIQSVAWRACRDLATLKGDDATEKAKEAKALMAHADRMQRAAAEHVNVCLTAVASCHGLEAIPDVAEIDDRGPRVVITWDDPKPGPEDGDEDKRDAITAKLVLVEADRPD